jgi:hypothetical protein
MRIVSPGCSEGPALGMNVLASLTFPALRIDVKNGWRNGKSVSLRGIILCFGCEGRVRIERREERK